MNAVARVRRLDRDHARGGRHSGLWDSEYVRLRAAWEAEAGRTVPGAVVLPVTGPKRALRARRVALRD